MYWFYFILSYKKDNLHSADYCLKQSMRIQMMPQLWYQTLSRPQLCITTQCELQKKKKPSVHKFLCSRVFWIIFRRIPYIWHAILKNIKDRAISYAVLFFFFVHSRLSHVSAKMTKTELIKKVWLPTLRTKVLHPLRDLLVVYLYRWITKYVTGVW
ncbi:uncharacterized protein BYT42DRAFT_551344 [Radiomyces spectabilis]|uniref:uncharacterized protein n=1 Tax=Radiomyces spectabilis TaxID=64574 RepID=UPI002220E936|nr:uncharacterized protein BYT42DRAFT_551344 [Radiomyces spectabilis]KAI8393522.1 hypothetical protein BYT42DRAFT_551344 [Radiomyces spectabilis]